MAEATKPETGTEEVQPGQDVAATAYRMARELWLEETKKPPKASDARFVVLTFLCAQALSHQFNVEHYLRNIASVFSKS